MKRFIAAVSFLFLLQGSLHALTLQEGLKTVSSRGRDVVIAQEEASRSEEDVRIVRSHLLPKVDIYAHQTWLRYEPEAEFGPAGPVALSEKASFTYGFQLKQLIYDFGKTTSLLRAARYGLSTGRLNIGKVRNLTALGFIRAYFDLLEAESLLGVAEHEVQRFEAHLNDTRAFYEEGLIIRNDLLQAEVLLSDAEQRSITAENLYQMRVSEINRLILRPLNDPVKAEDIEFSPMLDVPLEDAWKEADGNRAEIKSIDYAIKAAEAGLKSLRAGYLPTLYIAGGYEFQENRYMVHESNWSLITGLTMNIFEGGATRAKVGKKETEIRRLRAEREKLLDGIHMQVKRAYLDLKGSMHKVSVTKKVVKQARENLRLQKIRYSEGVGTATEVTDAVALLTTAESNYYRALYDTRRAQAGLLYSMGRNLSASYGRQQGGVR
ncbi:MAG TPA: TolC family protein [Nitrospirae bacterium]|nr:TolC family protein [Nitrospirota bacterium]HDY71237.1 TolC family protein [Nitrospirota bacterium]